MNHITESEREYVDIVGEENPHIAWILSPRDVHYPNPYYNGPHMPHPEERWDEPEDLSWFESGDIIPEIVYALDSGKRTLREQEDRFDDLRSDVEELF